jgi:hypothetical protein
MNAVSTHNAGVASGINNAASRVAGLVTIAVFGIVAVKTFSTELSPRLEGLPPSLGGFPISPADRAALRSQANRLVGARIPADLHGAARVAAQRAIELAFVHAFRTLMLVAAGMAFLGTLCAALLIAGREER